jgi:hypothetical protein
MRRACFLALAMAFGGCERRAPVAQVAAVAASPTGGRGAAAAQLVSRWKAGDHDVLTKARDLAFEQLDSAKSGQPGPTTRVVSRSVDATAFAGAVLDALEQLTQQLPMDAEHELFWMRVGGLAFAASEEAFAGGRLVEARSLVFAGGQRWQNEAYWMMHTGHDALASGILAQSGERAEAVRRLEERTDLNGPAAEMLEWLRKGR